MGHPVPLDPAEETQVTTPAERIGAETRAIAPPGACVYRVNLVRDCGLPGLYWLYADDCGCLLEGEECVGHPACELHAQIARAENRVTSIHIIHSHPA